jgi:hypothetical protein
MYRRRGPAEIAVDAACRESDTIRPALDPMDDRVTNLVPAGVGTGSRPSRPTGPGDTIGR